MNELASYPKPNPRRLYGLTHTRDGSPILRESRFMRVAIGQPSGKDIQVFINEAGKWCITIGKYDGGKRTPATREFHTRQECEEKYKEIWPTVAMRNWPLKLPYFTFLRINPDVTFVHDFEAIELYGPMPTELSIVFMKEEPFDAAYQMWTKGELKCEGDGLNARRRLSLAKTPEEKELAAAAQAAGEKFFPIVNGCADCNCPYSTAPGDDPVPCKPHGRLHFQLAELPRVGSTVCFDTTGKASIGQIFTGIHGIRQMTGHGDSEAGRVYGIPLTMALRPYKTSRNGKSSIQYGVNIEYRAENANKMAALMIEQQAKFRAITLDAPLAIAAPHEEEEDSHLADSILTAEFYTDGPGEDADIPDGSLEDQQAELQRQIEAVRAKGAKVTEIKADAMPDPPAKPTPVPEPAKTVVTNNTFEATDEDLPSLFSQPVDRKQIIGDMAKAEVAAGTYDRVYTSDEEPAWRADIRNLEIKLKALRKGGRFKDILDRHGFTAIEQIDELKASEIICDLDEAVGEGMQQSMETDATTGTAAPVFGSKPPAKANRFGGVK